MNVNLILNLVNSKEINDGNNIGNEQIKKEKLKYQLNKKYQIRNELAENMNDALQNENGELIDKYEKDMKDINDEIEVLLFVKETENKNQQELLELSKEDRVIRNIENKIGKIILDDYFENKNDKLLIEKEYEQGQKNLKLVYKI